MSATTKTRSSKSGTGMEIGEYAAMMRRMVRGYGKRLSDADPTELADALAIVKAMDDMIAESVKTMREQGFTWAQIGEYTGTTRQAAQQRWGKR